jgi:hypothetical protein
MAAGLSIVSELVVDVLGSQRGDFGLQLSISMRGGACRSRIVYRLAIVESCLARWGWMGLERNQGNAGQFTVRRIQVVTALCKSTRRRLR